jgi:hypothetical protein
MDASSVAVTQHRNLGTSMPSGGVHPIAYLFLAKNSLMKAKMFPVNLPREIDCNALK